MALRLNIGSCDLPLPKPWINIDLSTSPHIKADLILDGRKLDSHFHENSVDEIYAGHFVEHLMPEEVEEWFAMCFKILKKTGVLCVVTPDFRYIVDKYLQGDENFGIDRLINTYIFSYVQESTHRTIWDRDSMEKLFERHGFSELIEIDRINDDRLAYGVPWQIGFQGMK